MKQKNTKQKNQSNKQKTKTKTKKQKQKTENREQKTKNKSKNKNKKQNLISLLNSSVIFVEVICLSILLIVLGSLIDFVFPLVTKKRNLVNIMLLYIVR